MTASKKLKALFAGAFAVALCFALAGCGGSSGSSAASSSATSSSASSTSASASAASSSVTSSAAASSTSTASSSTSASASSASAAAQASSDLVDEHGNVTLYALISLTGPELTDLLQTQGYAWNDSKTAWLREVDGATYFALREAGMYSLGDYSAATEKGGTAKAVSCNIVGGFKDAQSAFAGNAHCVIEDSFFDEEGAGVAVIYGPTMEEYFVVAQQYTESTFELDVYSKQAVASGMLDQIYEGTIGGTFLDAWKTFTGKDSYGH